MIKNCAFCGMQFDAERVDVCYCSKECKDGAGKRRQEEWGLRELHTEKYEQLRRYAKRVNMRALTRKYKPKQQGGSND